MKKIIVLSFLLLSGGFLFSGCTKKETNTELNKQTQVGEFRKLDFGQPEREPDVRGLVKSMVGNEITILKIERGQGGENLNNPDREKTEAGATSLGGSTGRIPGMGGGMGGSSRLSGDAADQAAMLERMKEMSTGEEKILIPVGIQMLKPDSNESDSEPIEATLADIKIDKMIQIWFDENTGDRKIANFVMITK